MKFFRHTEETKNKISMFNKGKVRTQEQRDKISKAGKGRQTWLGKKHSLESIEKIRKAKIGRIQNEDEKLKRAKSLRKIDKWPHELGSRCKCEECKVRWNSYYGRKLNVQSSNYAS